MAQSLRRQRHSLRWLHDSAALLMLGRYQAMALKRHQGVPARRARQRQKLGQRLLETEIQWWPLPSARTTVFWTGLRWGGAGFILAWWLKS